MIEDSNAQAQRQARHVLGFIADCQRAHYTEQYRKQYEADNPAGFYVVDSAKYDRLVERERARFEHVLFNVMTADSVRNLAALVRSGDRLLFSDN